MAEDQIHWINDLSDEGIKWLYKKVRDDITVYGARIDGVYCEFANGEWSGIAKDLSRVSARDIYHRKTRSGGWWLEWAKCEVVSDGLERSKGDHKRFQKSVSDTAVKGLSEGSRCVQNAQDIK